MAKIKLPSYLKQGSGRMDDAILARWKGITYMKPYKKPKVSLTENQLSVRMAFSSLVADWKYLSGIVQTAWNNSVEGKDLTGYNAFIGSNSSNRRNSELLKLCPSMGENMVLNFSVVEGSTTGTISCSFSPLDAGKHLSLFIRKETTAEENTVILRQDCGADPVSPVTISSLETGARYTVYALATDTAYDSAQKVSQSTAGTADAA